MWKIARFGSGGFLSATAPVGRDGGPAEKHGAKGQWLPYLTLCKYSAASNASWSLVSDARSMSSAADCPNRDPCDWFSWFGLRLFFDPRGFWAVALSFANSVNVPKCVPGSCSGDCSRSFTESEAAVVAGSEKNDGVAGAAE